MWAIITVATDSSIQICAKSSSAETPATISGVTSGISISTLLEEASLRRARTRPKASVVAEDGPDDHRHRRDLEARERASRAALIWREFLVPLEAEAGEVLQRRLELNENSATTTSGANEKTRKAKKKTRRKRGLSNPAAHARASRVARDAVRR